MNTQGHPLDLLLREATGSPEPTESDYLHGRRMLNAAIAAETRTSAGLSRVGSWLPRVAAIGASFVVVVAIGIAISLVRPQPVTALGELANVAEQVERTAPADGEALYSRSSQTALMVREGADFGFPELGTVGYLVPRNVETWISDGTWRVSRATLQPIFFDPEVERAYFEAGLDAQDGIGLTVEDTFSAPDQIVDERNWPTTPGLLRQALESYVSNEGSSTADDHRVVELAAVLLRETNASPELRAAAIRVLEDLDVDVTERSDGQGVSVGFEYVNVVPRMRVIEFDADSNLIREYEKLLEDDVELGIPAGTIVTDATYSPVRVVPNS